jgi:ketosteroid isomerase-like protein
MLDASATAEARALAERLTRSTWQDPNAAYGARDFATTHTADAIAMPANHAAQRGRDAIAAWYAKRSAGRRMHVQVDVNTVDIIGDLAIVVATFRVARDPEEAVAAVDHAGNWLAVFKREDGDWKLWRDMDTNSPDGDHWYTECKRDMK